MSDSAQRSACHPPSPPPLPSLCLCLDVALSLRKASLSFSVSFCLLLPLHLLFSFSLSFQMLFFLFILKGGRGLRCDFLKEMKSNRHRISFFPAFLIFTLLYLCSVWPLMRADVRMQRVQGHRDGVGEAESGRKHKLAIRSCSRNYKMVN